MFGVVYFLAFYVVVVVVYSDSRVRVYKGVLKVELTVTPASKVDHILPRVALYAIANPIGRIIAARLMLNYLSAKHNDSYLRKVSEAINEGIKIVITKKKVLTPDLGGNVLTSILGNEVKKGVLNILNFFS